jgi:hypothetical protein
MAFPTHSCDPNDPCPVLTGTCDGQNWRAVQRPLFVVVVAQAD